MTDDVDAGNDGDDDDDDVATERLQRVASRRDLDAGALDCAHQDAQLTLEQTLQSFSDLSGKAFRLIRLNALVITILVAVSS